MDWIAALLAHLESVGCAVVEPTTQAEQSWVAHVDERANETLYPLARSYYNGAELPGKPAVFMPYVGGVRDYRRILEGVVQDGYRGFVLRNPVPTGAVLESLR